MANELDMPVIDVLNSVIRRKDPHSYFRKTSIAEDCKEKLEIKLYNSEKRIDRAVTVYVGADNPLFQKAKSLVQELETLCFPKSTWKYVIQRK